MLLNINLLYRRILHIEKKNSCDLQRFDARPAARSIIDTVCNGFNSRMHSVRTQAVLDQTHLPI